MRAFYSRFIFSLLVTIVMNGLDMTYHLMTSWAVHLNYVAIKLTVIFFTVWIITEFIGTTAEQGIVASILGPVMFYLYYTAANATLDRTVFKIDEQFWFVFWHIFFMLIAYFSTRSVATSKQHWLKKTSFITLVTFGAVALDAVFLMSRWHLQGLDEETATLLMTFNLITLPLMTYAASAILSIALIRLPFLDKLIPALIPAAVIFIAVHDSIHAVFAGIIALLIYYLINRSTHAFARHIT